MFFTMIGKLSLVELGGKTVENQKVKLTKNHHLWIIGCPRKLVNG